MGQAIGQVIPFGIGVAVSPLAIIAVVLMLAAPGGRVTGGVFLAAWALGLAVVGTLVLLVADVAHADDSGSPAEWVSFVKVALGALLLLIAAQQWRGRPGGDAEPELPAWLQKVDALAPGKAAGLAVVLAVVKPKNLLLTIGAAVAVAQTGERSGAQAVALGVFVFLGSLGPGIPVGIALLMRDRAGEILGRARAWMVRENATIVAVLCLAIAAKLIVDAVSSLAG